MRTNSLAILLAALLPAASSPPALTPSQSAAVRHVSAQSLRGRLSFLSSDLLEGRDTPSRGLDVAAEYIASEFRRFGLEPGGDPGYLQRAELDASTPNPSGFTLTFRNGGTEVTLGPDQAGLSIFDKLDLTGAPVYKLDFAGKDVAKTIKAEDIAGKVLLMQDPRQEWPGGEATFAAIVKTKPSLIVVVGGDREEPATRLRRRGQMRGFFSLPRVAVYAPDMPRFFEALPQGVSTATASVHADAAVETKVRPSNVVGILRGSDPVLKDTCVMLTAHYDHIGMKAGGPGDRVYNGANDDGSGTVSVLEIAEALAAGRVRPRRSIVFVTFFGEEKGELGSQYYGQHPVCPLEKTVADINLEQVGRTDSTIGPQKSNASLTGFKFSTVSDVLVKAGALTGVKVYRDAKSSDPYFALSDNQALADVGIPAHTLCVAFNFPDYHGVGDEWEKVDYDNMAKVDRTVAVALLSIANSSVEPRWNANEPKAAPYLKKWTALHAAGK